MSRFLKIAFFFFIGILLIWWSLHQIPPEEWDKFTIALQKSKFWFILPVGLILSLSHLVRALRWRLIMEPLGYKPSIINTFLSVLIGYLANLAVPRLGEVLKCTLLSKYEKVPAEKIVGTIVAERAFDVISLGIVFLLALTLQFSVVEAGWNQFKAYGKAAGDASQSNQTIYIIIAVILLAAIAALLFFKSKMQNAIITIKKIIAGVWEGVMSATKLKKHNLFFFWIFSVEK
jgi:uncharacterized protein (TIRG00374 family)